MKSFERNLAGLAFSIMFGAALYVVLAVAL